MAIQMVVTGSAGELGSNLARRLVSDGVDVRGVDLRASAVDGVEHHIGDVRDAALMKQLMTGADAVVHCASALPSYSADQIRSVVVAGTRTVLEAARAAHVGRVVHISSTAVYGLPKVVPTPEDAPRIPVDPYSAAKVAAEQVCEQFRGQGMSIPILRPKTFLGPGRLGLFAMLFEWADEGRNFPVLGRADVVCQMLATEDLVDAIKVTLTADEDVAHGTYNIAAAEFTTLRDDFQCVLDAAGHGKRVMSIPAKPALLVLSVLDRAGLSPVYGRLLHKLLSDSYVSIERARDRLDFTPRFSNKAAILHAYEWWHTHREASAVRSGRTSREPWKQGALTLAKAVF